MTTARSRQSIHLLQQRFTIQTSTKPVTTNAFLLKTRSSLSAPAPLEAWHGHIKAMSTMSTTSNSSSYESPYADLFDRMKRNETYISSTTSDNKRSRESTETDDIPKLKCGIPEYVLKFRTTNFAKLHLPPYVQKNEFKVHLTVSLRHIPLSTELEYKIFRQIVDNRFLEGKNQLRLSCNLFASRIENKRHLCNMLDRIVLGAQRLAKEIVEEEQKQREMS